ncbi:MAG: hypothetical protein IRZ08_09730, partial [Frankia sp.]|nr:hypothetical protein [Frankia sp.]
PGPPTGPQPTVPPLGFPPSPPTGPLSLPGMSPPAGAGQPRPPARGGRALTVVLIAAVAVLAVAVGVLSFLLVTGDSDDGDGGAAAPAAPEVTGPPGEALRALLNPETMTNCEDVDPRAESRYPDAAVRCTTPDGVVVRAFHYPDRSAADRHFGALAAFVVDQGDCEAGQPSEERWSQPSGDAGGSLLCYYFAENFLVFWTYDDLPVAFITEGTDARALAAWRRDFDPVQR